MPSTMRSGFCFKLGLALGLALFILVAGNRQAAAQEVPNVAVHVQPLTYPQKYVCLKKQVKITYKAWARGKNWGVPGNEKSIPTALVWGTVKIKAERGKVEPENDRFDAQHFDGSTRTFTYTAPEKEGEEEITITATLTLGVRDSFVASDSKQIRFRVKPCQVGVRAWADVNYNYSSSVSAHVYWSFNAEGIAKANEDRFDGSGNVDIWGTEEVSGDIQCSTTLRPEGTGTFEASGEMRDDDTIRLALQFKPLTIASGRVFCTAGDHSQEGTTPPINWDPNTLEGLDNIVVPDSGGELAFTFPIHPNAKAVGFHVDQALVAVTPRNEDETAYSIPADPLRAWAFLFIR